MSAGMTPRVDGVIQFPGRVGRDVSIEQAQLAAAIAVTNALAAVTEALEQERELDRVLRMTVYVRAGDDFEQHSMVADGASHRLTELLGTRGRAARAAVGVASLPGGACVEVELMCSWRFR